MIREGLTYFRGKRVLLLQGPFGPFFRRFARDLTNVGAVVNKVNFHGGDWVFYPTNAINYRGKLKDWPAFFEQLLIRLHVDIVILFGDCRAIHRCVRDISQEWGVEVGVFEEGYVRPDYITFERYGVNAHSRVPRNPDYYYALPRIHNEQPMTVGDSLWYAVFFSILYYTAGILLWPFFPYFRNHRPMSLVEGFRWLGSDFKKKYYAWREKGIQQRLETSLSGKFYLFPLQVHNDAQVRVHSKFRSMEQFMRFIMESFATHAPKETHLVIKHHPLDRAYNDYTKFIEANAARLGICDRVLYIHDQHLPTLLKNARGVVSLNSTVGMSALHHGAPLKVCGKAIYDIEGLTYRGPLDKFWTEGQPCDEELYKRFRSFLILHTQLNGNFYKRLPIPGSDLGVRWGSSYTVKEQTPHVFQPKKPRGGARRRKMHPINRRLAA